ncbi:MAG TPA: RNA methyltransferase [Solirubrobacteraceae bacterium]|jgi:TrmH family RNA methyltransferase|nr:RNA methyltransferase [Solirubrobacteraceae bacterium]
MTISSPQNERLKEIRKLNQRRRARDHSGRFVAEGEDLLAAADAAGWEAVDRYCAAGSGLQGIEVEPKLLAAASELGSGTRTLAVYEERWAPAATGPLCVCLYGVGDPGNVGTVLRSAEAFGAASVVIGPGTADPFGPKAVRASMGAVFSVPLARATTLGDLPGETVALDAVAPVPLDALVLSDTVTLLVGAERAGLPADVISACDQVARIPIVSHSLNAAMAATVALYEASRMARG